MKNGSPRMPEISKMLASVCSMLRCIRAPKQMLGSIEPVYLRTISWNRGFCAVSTGVSLDVRSTFSIVSSATESRQTDFIFGYEDISELHTHRYITLGIHCIYKHPVCSCDACSSSVSNWTLDY